METPCVCRYDSVYDPREDTFLLLDALESDLDIVSDSKLCLEIGSGSGAVISAVAAAIPGSYCLAVDINPEACRATKETARKNRTEVEVVRANLLDWLRKLPLFDLIIFNPPYVPSESLDLLKPEMVDRAWAGGTSGREIMELIFPEVHRILAPNGLFYLVVVQENEPEVIVEKMARFDLVGEVVKSRKVPGERLSVLRFRFSRGK